LSATFPRAQSSEQIRGVGQTVAYLYLFAAQGRDQGEAAGQAGIQGSSVLVCLLLTCWIEPTVCIFEQAALAENKQAALMESDRPDVFSTRIGNLKPGEQWVINVASCT
jgi:hypothetical protein